MLKQQKAKIEDLDERVSASKAAYNDALKRLEEISEEIHRMRKERGASPLGSEEPKNGSDGAESSSVDEDPMDDVINRFNSCAGINSTDEYKDFPQKMGVKSSPVRQKKVGALDCPHMYQDFTSSSSSGPTMMMVSGATCP